MTKYLFLLSYLCILIGAHITSHKLKMNQNCNDDADESAYSTKHGSELREFARIFWLAVVTLCDVSFVWMACWLSCKN